MESGIPYTVIGGYLGTGKTTLLNHILRHSAGRRFALLINDFGSINIDAELIEGEDGDVMSLANGCICCTLAAGFAVAINTLLEQDPLPDHVVVEASGVSDPGKVARYGQTRPFSSDGVIVVVDSETVRTKANDKYVGRTVLQQIQSADLLVLNKIDLVTTEQKQVVRDWLMRAQPKCRTDAQFAACSFVEERPLRREAFERLLGGLPASILRAKGALYLREAPERRMIFQMVGQRWSLTPDRSWGEEPPQSRVVWLGLQEHFDQPGLLVALSECAQSTGQSMQELG